MNDVAIVGIGSPFGADNLAEQVIQKLKPVFQTQKLHVLFFDRPGIKLIEFIQKFKIVHLIDVIITEKTIGKVYRFEGLSEFKKKDNILSTHGLGLMETLALAEAMNLLRQKIIIHGITVDKNIYQKHEKLYTKAADLLVQQLQQELLN